MKRLKNIFNVRLYLEGLKRLKVMGIAASIAVIGICAMIPVTYIIDHVGVHYTDKPYVYDVSINEFAIPLILILFIAPFFVSSIFSYLNRRNESDFYHAIPYKRACVFNSFMLSTLTWVLGIITASVALCSILWGIAPYASFDMKIPFLLILSTFASCLILMCFMALAMSLTGTVMSNLFIFGLLSLFVRVAFALFSFTVEEVIPIWRSGETLGVLLEPGFFFPIALLGGTLEIFEAADVYSNLALYIYTFLSSIAIYALAAFFYGRRRSEMAGKSAPSKRLQHIYRIAFTTPFVLLLSSFVTESIFSTTSYGVEIIHIVLTALVLFVYYLYELITTRSPKSMLKSTPYLLVLVLIAGVYVGGVSCMRAVVLSNAPDADEMSYVVFDYEKEHYSLHSKSYEELKCEDVAISEEKVLEGVSDALKFSIEKVQDGTWSRNRELADVKDAPYYKDENYRTFIFTNVKIKLKNGQTISRCIKMYTDEYTALMRDAKNTDEYGDAYLAIPRPEQLYAAASESLFDSDADWKELYSCYYEEYNSLSREDKIEAKDSQGFSKIVGLLGREGFEQFDFSMRITTKTPKTLKMFVDMDMKRLAINSSKPAEDWISVHDTVEKIFSIIKDEGEKLYNQQSNTHIEISVQIYGQNGENLVGNIYNSTGDRSSTYKEAEALVDALYKYRGKYSTDKYILAVSIGYNGYEGEEYEYLHASPVYFVDEDFVIELSRYIEYLKVVD